MSWTISRSDTSPIALVMSRRTTCLTKAKSRSAGLVSGSRTGRKMAPAILSARVTQSCTKDLTFLVTSTLPCVGAESHAMRTALRIPRGNALSKYSDAPRMYDKKRF